MSSKVHVIWLVVGALLTAAAVFASGVEERRARGRAAAAAAEAAP